MLVFVVAHVSQRHSSVFVHRYGMGVQYTVQMKIIIFDLLPISIQKNWGGKVGVIKICVFTQWERC